MSEQQAPLRAAARAAPRAGRSAFDGPPELAMRDEMLLLHRRVDALLAGRERRILHFAAARPGEGTSTIVRAYGHALAEVLDRTVLIVDANEANPGQHRHFAVSGEPGWADVVAGVETVERALHATGHPNLSISPFSGRVGGRDDALDRAAVERLFALLRERFDAILIDGSPVASPSAIGFAARPDGVVLVVEADRTRWPVVLRARELVEESGGTVLGIVLNRRRHYIPEGVYRRL